MKEPLLWFVLIGILIFTADHFRSPDPIIVDDSIRNQISTRWETQMGAPPDDKELEALVNDWVRQEVFYREALKLGLEQDDTIIRRQLVQKLSFIAPDLDDNPVTIDDIRSHYEKNINEYAQPARYTLSQIYFSDVKQSAQLLEQLAEGQPWQGLGESSLLPRSLVNKSRREISSIVGPEFTGQLDNLVRGQWIGPVSSSYGLHLVRLDDLTPEEKIPLASIQQSVTADLLHQRREQALEKYYHDLSGQYEVQYQ